MSAAECLPLDDGQNYVPLKQNIFLILGKSRKLLLNILRDALISGDAPRLERAERTERADGWTDGRTDGWTDGRTGGRADGRTGEPLRETIGNQLENLGSISK